MPVRRALRMPTIFNTLGPILMNLGNLAYVLVALAGGTFLTLGVPNLGFGGMALSIDKSSPKYSSN